MSRGKTTCKILKEVRRKIADANGIPLSERECTHKGDCAGTCPYCESEVRYLERELSKRKCLGKAVAVAGIALSAVTMAGCATSEPVSSDSANKPSKTSGRDITNALSWMGAVVVDDNGKPAARNPEKNKLKKEKRQKNCDTLQLRGIVLDMDESRHDTAQKEITFDESLLLDTEEDKHETDKDKVVIGLVDDWGSQNWNVNEERPAPESIPGFTPAVFTEGKLEDWLGEHLTQFQTYMQELRVDSVEICFFVEEDGTVSLINIQNMPEVYEPKDEAFRAKVVAVISGTE